MVRGLQLEQVVLHGIKKALRGSGIEPDLTDEESPLSDQVRVFLETQLSSAMKHRREIVEEPNMSTLPNLIRDVWSGTTSLLDASQVLARNLQSTQPGIGSEGLLMVAKTRSADGPGFLVAKLEHEKGTSAELETNAAGMRVFATTFLDNLFFTEGSKVYKIGYFPLPADVTAPLPAFVVDRQVSGTDVAVYFRETYLGCAWKEKPEIMTERFVDTVQAWIDTVADPEKRSRYQLALITDLQSRDDFLSMSGFASRYLDDGDRDSFTRHASQTLPAANLTKDLTLVETRIANVRLDTRSGTVVIATPQAIDDGIVTVKNEPSGATVITVADEITKTSGTGRFKQS